MFSLLNNTQSKSLILGVFIACSLETTSTIPETTTSSIEPISNTTTSTERKTHPQMYYLSQMKISQSQSQEIWVILQ